MARWIKVTECCHEDEWLVNLDNVSAIHPPIGLLWLGGFRLNITKESMERLLKEKADD